MTTAPPWFPLWWKDFLADDKVIPMGGEAVGAFVLLLIAQWQSGSLPDDLTRLQGLAKVPADRWDSTWTLLAPCFPLVDGRRANRRLEHERRRTDARIEQRCEAGRASGRARREAASNARSTPVEEAFNGRATNQERRARQPHTQTQTATAPVPPAARGVVGTGKGKSPPEDVLRLRNALLAAIEAHHAENPHVLRRARQASAAGQWDGDLDKLLRIGPPSGVPVALAEAISVADWLPSAPVAAGGFTWAGQVQSGRAFRGKYPSLLGAMQRSKKAGRAGVPPGDWNPRA